ncbi:MAG: GNAT family N-acetyltransferase [Lactobacillus sp.]|nr:GNAT family N-acetyltransferase [Lactobacillus sp.]
MAGFICLDGDIIEMLYVRPEYMNQGIGSQLVKYLFNNHKPKQIGVDKDNAIAQHIYKKFGFQIVGEHNYDHCGVWDPHYIMKIPDDI